MFCPNCGSNNTAEQSFCRSCGLNLEQTALSLLQQIPSAESAKLLKHEQRVKNFGNFAVGSFGLAVFAAICGIVYMILTKMVLSGLNFWGGLLFIFFILSAGLLLAYVILNESINEKWQKKSAVSPGDVTAPKTTGKLLDEGDSQPVPSVTENSTELLYVEYKTSKLE